MTPEETLRQELQEMITRIAGEDADTVKNMPMAFALATAEVAYHMGVTAGMMRARDQIAAHFSKT